MSSSPFKPEEQECSAYYETNIFKKKNLKKNNTSTHLPQIFSEGFRNPNCFYGCFFFSLWVLICKFNTKKPQYWSSPHVFRLIKKKKKEKEITDFLLNVLYTTGPLGWLLSIIVATRFLSYRPILCL